MNAKLVNVIENRGYCEHNKMHFDWALENGELLTDDEIIFVNESQYYYKKEDGTIYLPLTKTFKLDSITQFVMANWGVK